MAKYTRELIECSKCYKSNNFIVEVVEKDKKSYYLTKCPKCNSYDEVKILTQEAARLHKSSNKD